ncbi:cellular retinoic acid-binding protein 2 [Lemur catta]|uniref:cellular retinoic acid-binding protein 2 n=1 Tax=Lemur catta TaxID=9447 RepID=UPI001E26E3C3|nr:cellular retinoic acid-binding protein 2 [Lemur catta]
MPNFSGNWKIIRSENFEDLLKALEKGAGSWGGGPRRLNPAFSRGAPTGAISSGDSEPVNQSPETCIRAGSLVTCPAKSLGDIPTSFLGSPNPPTPTPAVDEVMPQHIPRPQLERSLRATCPPQALLGGRLKANPLDKHSPESAKVTEQGPQLRVNVMLRKIAVAAASKPAVEIKHEGDTFYIKTSTTVRTTEINFKIGEEFEEQTVDGRPCKSLVKWESENKMVCEQRLLKGEGPQTSWTRELTNDGELILTMTADDVVCTRVYVRE